MIQNNISSAISQLPNTKNLYVLVGFNRWLDIISNDLDETSQFLDLPSADEDITIDLTALNSAFQSGKPIYFSAEAFLWLSNNSLAGIPKMYSYEVVCVQNDIFSSYYPDSLTKSESLAKQALYQSDTDNHIQTYYSDYQIRGDNGYIIYNLSMSEFNQTLTISSLLESPVNPSLSGSSIEIPEEFDNVTYSEIVLSIISDGISRAIIASEVREQHKLVELANVLKSLGIGIEYKEYRTEPEEIDQDRANAYRSILHRKNPNYDFYDIPVYTDPYEDTSLSYVNQIQIIDDIVKNSTNSVEEKVFRDVFVTAPTGAGKSVMFQIPAIYLAEKENLLTIVVSPLIGLMNDQIENIQSMTNAAATINSDYTPLEKESTLERVKSGEVSILYLSPESLLSNSDITSLIGDRKIGLFVVDEAHIVATWGKSFRPDYWYLGEFIQRLRNDKHSQQRFPIVTFTATATFGGDENMYQEIVDSLNMTPVKYIGNVKRDDIQFDVRHKTKELAYREEKMSSAITSINELQATGQKTLVYVPYTQHIFDIHQNIADPDHAARYYGGMMAADKNETLNDIKNGNKNVVIATKAFGMGIDIDDIKYVYHFAPTGNIADYIQEIGRAARRKDMTGVAVTDFYKEDFRYVNQLYGMSSIKNYQVIAVLQKIYDLFTKYKKRNFLVAPEEFSYIFADARPDDVDAKLKTTLLIIKKDFEQSSSSTFIPLIFKPRGLFTEGYFTIHDGFVDTLKSRGLLRYFEPQGLPRQVQSLDSQGNTITTKQAGDTYKLNFKHLWEDRFKDISFGMFKRQFFENDLPGFSFKVGEMLLPRIIIEINGGAARMGEIRGLLMEFLYALQSVFDDFKQAGKHITTEQIAAALLEKTSIKKKSVAVLLGSSIIELLKRVNTGSLTNTYGFSSYNSVTNKYTIRNNSYERSIRVLKRCAMSMLANVNDTKAMRYAQNKMGSNEIIVAQLIELLELADVRISSGQNPEFFIRVNNPSAIERILNNKSYNSRTVMAVGRRHRESAQLMEYFFTRLSSDQQRWEFIERYFLGMLETDSTLLEFIDQQKPTD